MEFDQPIQVLLQIACVCDPFHVTCGYVQILQDSRRDCKQFEPHFNLR